MSGEKIVRITIPEVHDGLGGVHKQGDVVALPGEIADLFIAKNCGVEATDADYQEAVKSAAGAAETRRIAAVQGGAIARMRTFDLMPPEVRAAARDEGDGAMSTYLHAKALKQNKPKTKTISLPKPPRDKDDETAT